MHSSIIAQVLVGMGVHLPQRKFLTELLSTWLAVRGRFNCTNISRYSSLHERTLRRGFARDFCWPQFNRGLLAESIPADHELIAAMDASFVPKSGKKTFGLGYFFSGCAGRAQKGLELSLVSVVDVTRNTAYALSAKQTSPGEDKQKAKPQQNFAPKGEKSKGEKSKGTKSKAQKVEDRETRIDDYLAHFKSVRSHLSQRIVHLVVDGYFTNYKFVQGVCDLKMEVVGKLRRDANLRYLYHGPQKKRGRPRLYGEKVQWSKPDLRRWKNEGEIEDGVKLYSSTLYHVSLKRTLRVAMLQYTSAGQVRHALFFGTDLQLSGRDILRYYKARFQIEFLFRDAKQSTGLNDCQARNSKTLNFHWNAALCVVNLAKWEEVQRDQKPGFSMFSCKLRHSNQRMLEVFSNRLGLDWNAIKLHPTYLELTNYGVIQP